MKTEFKEIAIFGNKEVKYENMSKINIKDLEVNVKNQTQMVIEHFKNLPPKKLTDPIFNEDDPAKEKENFRNLIHKK